jgi:hypothetical protein
MRYKKIICLGNCNRVAGMKGDSLIYLYFNVV